MVSTFRKFVLAGLLALALPFSSHSQQPAKLEELAEKARRASLPYCSECEFSNGSKYEVTGRGFLFNDKYYLVPFHISKRGESLALERESENSNSQVKLEKVNFPVKPGFVNLAHSKLKYMSEDKDFHVFELDNGVARQYQKEKRFLKAKPSKQRVGETLYFLRGDGKSIDILTDPVSNHPLCEKTSISFVPSYLHKLVISTSLRDKESGTPFIDAFGNVRGFARTNYENPENPNRRATLGNMNLVLQAIK